MTWGEFKTFVEDQGVKDEDVIRYIDTIGAADARELDAEKTPTGWEIC